VYVGDEPYIPDRYKIPIFKRPFKQSMSGKKIMLYGDSISSTDYPWYKQFMEELTGAEVYNAGFSGFNSQQLALDCQLQRIFDYDPDLIICLVGANDTGECGTVGTFGATDEPLVQETDITQDYDGDTFIQAISHIQRKVEAYYYNFKKRAGKANPSTINRPYLVFCTTLCQNRAPVETNPFSQPVNWERKRDAIVESCLLFKVHCIDLFNMCSWDFSMEPSWTLPTDKVDDRGIYTMDGLHPNRYGAEYLSRCVCGDLGL